MNIRQLKTYWIMLCCTWQTGLTCLKAVVHRLRGHTERTWYDQEIHLWAQKVIRWVQVQVHIHNPKQVKPIPGVATIIMCNHTSLFDIPLSYVAFPEQSIRMLAKKELASIPIMSAGMRAAEFPFIDRKNRTQAIKDLEKVRKLLQTGVVLWMAPEGTRSKNGQLQPFKKGGFITAIQMQATIIPMVIKGADEIIAPKTHLLHLQQKATIAIGDPIDSSLYTLDNKDALIEKTWQAMHQLLEEIA